MKKDTPNVRKNKIATTKYQAILRVTLNPQSAQKGSKWSWTKIEAVYGVTPKKRLKNKKLYELRSQFYRKSNKVVTSQSFGKTISDRKKQWSEWSMKDDKGMISKFRELAKQINRMMGDGKFKDDDSYGFAVVYWAYIEGKTIEKILALMWVDRFDGNIYVYDKKL